MKTPVTATAETAETPTPDAVLFNAASLIDWLFGTATGMSLLRVLVTGERHSSQLECWLRARLRDDGTREWFQTDGGWAPKSAPTLDQILATYASMPLPERPTTTAPSFSVPGTTVAISPFLCRQMSSQIAEPWPAIWVAIKIRVFPASYIGGSSTGVIDVEDAKRVFTRLYACPIAPHVVIDEGDRAVALWKLATPFTDAEDPLPAEGYNSMAVVARMRSTIPPRRGSRLLFRLAHALQGDITDMARSENATILLPGQKIDLRSGNSPSMIVNALCLDPVGTTTIEALEDMATVMSENLRG